MDKVKALFFAQYLGQKVAQHTKSTTNLELQEVSCAVLAFSEIFNTHLLLRSIKDLTDDKALIIAKIYDNDCEWILDSSTDNVIIFKSGIETIWIYKDNSETIFEVEDLTGNSTAYNINNAYQYLLRIGILLPFTYLDEENKPITIQPDTIIEIGWAKYETL